MTHYPGVYQTKKKDGSASYRASITVFGRHISLGSFGCAKDASFAYAQAGALMRSADGIEEYAKERCALSFSKYVSLINLRDHGIYFKTPIYLEQKFFTYYLSPHISLIFDVDDLFFYSTHTIMKRGGHLFVADYGMQINLLSRYGVREHAVCGRDYLFANGNPYDFRYENIRIINRYHGVQKFQKDGRCFYRVKIHIRGDYNVGIFESETEAAVAYNKAADILRKNGCKKNFPENYPESLSESAYTAIYRKIRIPSKIIHYHEV